MLRLRDTLLLALWAIVLSASLAGAQERTVEEWIQRLRGDDAAHRIEALEELALLGERARPALERALQDVDPDTRFHALYLLRAPEGALERTLRRITFGRSDKPGATYRLSLKAYQGLMRRASPGVRGQLLRVSLRAAPQGQSRLVIVALSVWIELARGQEVAPGEAQLLAELLELDLGEASADLLEAFGALPPAQRLGALRGALTSKNTKVLARAARAVGETAEPSQVVEVRRLLLPLVGHSEARVRRQAVYSLGLLGVGDERIRLRVARACRDLDSGVAEIALRLVGEWKLRLARGAAEEIASDVNRPLKTRLAAIQTLGLTGDRAATPVLRRLARDQVEIGPLATWALAALGAPGLAKDIEQRIKTETGGSNPLYYRALARLGPQGRPTLRRCVLPQPPYPTGRALERLQIRTQRALDAYAYLRDPRAAQDLTDVIRRPVRLLRQSDRANRHRATEALCLRTDPLSQRQIAKLVIRPGPVRAEKALLNGIFRHSVPDDLRDEVAAILAERVPTARGTAPARALVRIDPKTARRILYPMVRARVDSRYRHDLALALARTGELRPLTSDALPFALRRLEASGEERVRLVWLVLSGLDHYYAGRLDEARLAFRRLHWTRPHWEQDTPAYNLACVAAAEGRRTQALRLLRRAVFHGYKRPELSRYDLDFIPLRRDPRFQQLIQQLELAVETGQGRAVLKLP
ncbi:MAG: hypothetical protein JKY65_07655 [Planctomycetes bacterium]|nr:hypothetical protein [Planctomycetota bacterium]